MRIRFAIFILAAAAIAAHITGILLPLLATASDLYIFVQKKFPSLPAAITGALITGGIAWIALRTNAAVNIRNKRMDVILHCNNRYDDLYKLRHEIEKDGAGGDQILSYFRRYWGLQSDQIDYWLAGYIDPETMASWVVSLTGSLENKSLGRAGASISYAASWNDDIANTHRVVNKRLTDTVDFSMKYLANLPEPRLRYAAALQYLRIIEANERSLIKALSRNHHSRMGLDVLATTVPSDVWENYNIFDVRMWPFRWIYRLEAGAWRGISRFSDTIQGNSLERLRLAIGPGKPREQSETNDNSEAEISRSAAE